MQSSTCCSKQLSLAFYRSVLSAPLGSAPHPRWTQKCPACLGGLEVTGDIQTRPTSSHLKKPVEPGYCTLMKPKSTHVHLPRVSFPRAGIGSKGRRDLFSSPHIRYAAGSGEPPAAEKPVSSVQVLWASWECTTLHSPLQHGTQHREKGVMRVNNCLQRAFLRGTEPPNNACSAPVLLILR